VRPALWVLVGCLVLPGCGEEASAPAAAESTATATASAAPPERARSVRDCVKLWNADEALDSAHQVSHTQFVAELARADRTPAYVAYERKHCYVTVPIGARRIAWFAAERGYAPFSNPERRELTRTERVPYNGRALRDGRIALD
jgi:hypothetical protein